MRLGKGTIGLVEQTCRRALSGECVVEVPAPSLPKAGQMFEAVSPHIEAAGGTPLRRDLAWLLPNGSTIRIVPE